MRSRIVHFFLRASAAPPSKEAVMEAIQQHTSKPQGGIRKGWQAKAATWVKKVHVDRGDVKVGTFRNGRFRVLDALRPRYIVPQGLENFELKPYVQDKGDSKP